MSSGKEVREPLRGHEAEALSVAVNDDCRVIGSASSDITVWIWNTLADEVKETFLRGHTYGVGCAALNSDGSRAVSGSWDGTVRIWNISIAKDGIFESKRRKSERQLLFP